MVEFEIGGLSAHRAVDRLLREGIVLLSARRTPKMGVTIAVPANVRKKVFTILRGTCYNIKKCRPAGLARFLEKGVRAVGLLIGAALALALVLFAQSRVLKVEVKGSGAYLEPQVRAVLSEHGVDRLSAMPQPETLIPAILSLPRVQFCSVKGEGGVLTVCVEVGDSTEPLRKESLFSPAAGTVEELVVLRGTPLVKIGDFVDMGQEIVANYALHGEEKEDCIVIARVRIAFPVSKEYALDEEGAKLQAFLEFGEIGSLHTTKTAQGWRIEGTCHAEGTMNFG